MNTAREHHTTGSEAEVRQDLRQHPLQWLMDAGSILEATATPGFQAQEDEMMVLASERHCD